MHSRFSRSAKCVSGNQTWPYFDFKIVILLSQQIHALKETTGQMCVLSNCQKKMCVLSEPVTLGNLHHVNPSLYWTMFLQCLFLVVAMCSVDVRKYYFISRSVLSRNLCYFVYDVIVMWTIWQYCLSEFLYVNDHVITVTFCIVIYMY